MLKRIRTEDVALGMFLHKLEGSWLAHPFWKRRFLLDDGEQLAELKASAVEWVMIDVSRGHDVAAPTPVPAPPPAMASAPSEAVAAPIGRSAQILVRARRSEDGASGPSAGVRPFARAIPLSNTPRGLADEMRGAADIAVRSRLVIRGLFSQARLGKAIDMVVVEGVVDDIIRSIQRHPHAFSGMMRLMKTSDYLYTHALAVSALMISLATQLGLKSSQVREAGLAGLLMDVGMGHVPQEIYDKEGTLTPDEEKIVRSHTHLAHDFMAMGGEVPESVLDVCLHHHERLDGSGYPHNLTDGSLSLFSRMAAICDIYDAMTSRRPHKAGKDPATVLAKMREDIHRVDPDIFDAFVRAVGIYPIGSLIRLASDRLAMVLDQNPKNPTLPRVRAFYSTVERRKIEPEDIDLVYRVGKDRILSNARAEDWGIDDWEKLSISLLRQATGVNVR